MPWSGTTTGPVKALKPGGRSWWKQLPPRSTDCNQGSGRPAPLVVAIHKSKMQATTWPTCVRPPPPEIQRCSPTRSAQSDLQCGQILPARELCADPRHGEEAACPDLGQGQPKWHPSGGLDNLFTWFGRTSVKATDGGRSTGLGIATTRRMVLGHQVESWVDSEVGKGSTFYVSILIPADGTGGRQE